MARSKINNSKSITSQKKTKHPIVFFLVALIFILAASFDCPEYLDLGRYYDIVHSNFSSHDHVTDVIMWSLLWNRDFIYFVLFWIFDNSFLSAAFLTGITCALYYYLVLTQLSNSIRKITPLSIILLVGLFCFPNIIWVFSIPRNITAYLFFWSGILLWFKNKKPQAIILFILTIFTHISCILHVAIFFATVFLYNIWLKNRPSLVKALSFLLPIISPLFVVTILNRFITSDSFSDSMGDMRYTQNDIEAMDAGAFDSFGYGDISVILFTFIAIYLLLIVDRNVSLKKVLLIVFGSLTIGMSAGAQVFMMRFMLCMPFFYALYCGELYSYCTTGPLTKHKDRILKVMLFNTAICSMGFVLLVYAYRFWTLL